LVYDTGSTDGTIEIVRSFPSVILVEMGVLNKYQLGACRNLMMEATKTKWAWQVDGDEYYPASSVEEFLKHDMPEGKKLGFTQFFDVGWDGANFRALPKFSRAALLDSSARYSGAYPFENPDIFDHSELFHYFPESVIGYHLHHLVRSEKDEDVYLRMRKRGQFCMMSKEVPLEHVLEIDFGEERWHNSYLEYLRRRDASSQS
jgi:glycosyltransferase involved in cell wall biosynthesis